VIDFGKKAGILLVSTRRELETLDDFFLLRYEALRVSLFFLERVVLVFDGVENMDFLLQVAVADQLTNP
jgi:hypothetical protein